MVETQHISEKGARLLDYIKEVGAVLVEDIELLEKLPEDFILVTLPQDDDDLARHALSLVPAQPDKPVIYALVNKASVTFLLPQGPLEASLEPP
jgi:hypothetical protein